MNELLPRNPDLDTSADIQHDGLYEDLIEGRPVRSDNITLSDEDTGEHVRIRHRGQWAMVSQADQWTMIGGSRLQLQSQAEEESSGSDTMTTLRASSRQADSEETTSLRPVPSRGVERILARDPEIRRRFLKRRQEEGDPVEALVELLNEVIGDSPEDAERWISLVDSPEE
jgi:hypothetical protein